MRLKVGDHVRVIDWGVENSHFWASKNGIRVQKDSKKYGAYLRDADFRQPWNFSPNKPIYYVELPDSNGNRNGNGWMPIVRGKVELWKEMKN